MHIFNDDVELMTAPLIQNLPAHIIPIGSYRNKTTTHTVVFCTVCKDDPELFGCGKFVTTKGHLSSGKLPCGCSKTPKWNKDQQIIRVNRKLEKTIWSLQDLPEPYIGQNTKLYLSCPHHGEWTSSITSVVNNIGCKGCATNATAEMKLDRNTPRLIADFLSTGVFHPETVFNRIERKNTQGARNYWNVYCPVCGSSGQCATSDLKRGNRPCKCFADQRYSYINLITDTLTNLQIGIKFGITSNFKDRLYRQNLKSIYNLVNIGIWEFSDSQTCKKVEQTIKKLAPCGVIPEQELMDGHTETTYISNIDLIIQLYEDHGGVRIN